MNTTDSLLHVEDLLKEFPGVVALDRVTLSVKRGTVHALVGENGAGKSTLVKCVSGVHQPDSGTMWLEAALHTPLSPGEAISRGVRVIYQEFNLVPTLTVAENVLFERLPNTVGLVNRRSMNKEAERLLARVGLEIPVGLPVERLGIAQKQLIEIAKALSTDSRLIVMDEPTATLTGREIEKLFHIIEELKKEGRTVIYISHRLGEIFEIADSVTVMRNGSVVATEQVENSSSDHLIRLMVGRDVSEEYPFREKLGPGEVVLDVRGLTYDPKLPGQSFQLKKGEILGIAGLVGSGRTELIRCLYGLDSAFRGQVFVLGKKLGRISPARTVSAGLGLLTENRKEEGLMLTMSCAANLSIASMARVSRNGLMVKKQEYDESKRIIDTLSIRTPGVWTVVGTLSGGNQQKLLVGRWLMRDVDIYLFDEPTRGIDVGAKLEIYNLMWDMVERGKSVVMISSDLPELIGICHRILVFSDGKIVANIPREEFDQKTILQYAFQEYAKSTEVAN
jgi:ribose transport system ATP-binding protein